MLTVAGSMASKTMPRNSAAEAAGLRQPRAGRRAAAVSRPTRPPAALIVLGCVFITGRGITPLTVICGLACTPAWAGINTVDGLAGMTSVAAYIMGERIAGGAYAVGLGALAGAILGALTGVTKTLTRAIQHPAAPGL